MTVRSRTPEAAFDRSQVANALRAAGVAAEVATDAAGLLPPTTIGVLLYGSYARGDQEAGSDVDLLILAPRPEGTRASPVLSVSTYTPTQLATAAGTLFGMHLARDGKIIFDPHGQLKGLLAKMGQPDSAALFARVRHLAAVLDDRAGAHLAGRVRVTRYLLRTAIYVQAIAAGSPCFSVRELALRLEEPDLQRILSANEAVAPAASLEVLDELRSRLVRTVGKLEPNPWGSLQNLIVSEWYEDHERATLAALALADEGSNFDYAALAKVLL